MRGKSIYYFNKKFSLLDCYLFRVVRLLKNSIYNQNILSNYFKGTSSLGTINGITKTGGTSSLEIYLDKEKFSTVDTFNEWIKTQSDNGNPLKIDYILKEENNSEKVILPNIPIDSSRIYLNVESSIKPSNIELEYIK